MKDLLLPLLKIIKCSSSLLVMEKRLKGFFGRHKINYEIYHHQAVFTVEESGRDADIKKIPGVRTKSLFLKSGGQFYLVTLPGEKRLNTKSLKQHLGIRKLHFASSEEMKSEINLAPGSVSPCGLIYSKNTHFILDSGVWAAEKSGFHPNTNTATIVLSHSDLEKFYRALSCKKEIIKLA